MSRYAPILFAFLAISLVCSGVAHSSIVSFTAQNFTSGTPGVAMLVVKNNGPSGALNASISIPGYVTASPHALLTLGANATGTFAFALSAPGITQNHTLTITATVCETNATPPACTSANTTLKIYAMPQNKTTTIAQQNASNNQNGGNTLIYVILLVIIIVVCIAVYFLKYRRGY